MVLKTKIFCRYFSLFYLICNLQAVQSQTDIFEAFFITPKQPLSNPYAGGIRHPQFSQLDLDNDGKKDLFVFDKATNLIQTYINKGKENEVNYQYTSEYNHIFPRLETWALLRDFNHDGIEDIFTGGKSQKDAILIYCGSKSMEGKISFSLISNQPSGYLHYQENDTLFTPVRIPFGNGLDFIDIDGDIDLDILFFPAGDEYLTLYKNISVETGHNPDIGPFIKEDECFGKFKLSRYDSSVLLSSRIDSCIQEQNRTVLIHGGTSVSAIDINCDQRIDLLIGDGKTKDINLLINSGQEGKDWMTENIIKYPDGKTEISSFVSGYFMDINNDGVFDLILTHNDSQAGQTKDHVILFINEGDNCNPIFSLSTRNFLAQDMLSFGVGSHPSICDFNGDGLNDIVVGTHQVDTSGKVNNRLVLYKNITENLTVQYELEDEDFLGFSGIGETISGRLSPTFGDLDGDLDTDLIVGDGYGKLYYLENVAGQGKPYSFANPIYDYSGIYVGLNAVPVIFDLDKDGQSDLIISKWRHDVIFYKNIGSLGTPLFDPNPDYFRNIKNLGNLFPDLTDANKLNGSITIFESDKEIFLMLGTKDGEINTYKPVEEDLRQPFIKLNNEHNNHFFGKNIIPNISDVNKDGLFELLLGNESGGMMILKTSFKNQNYSEVKENISEVRIFPNPVYDQLFVFSENIKSIALLDVFGNTNIINHQKTDSQHIVADVSTISPGLYILKIATQNSIEYRTIIIQK